MKTWLYRTAWLLRQTWGEAFWGLAAMVAIACFLLFAFSAEKAGRLTWLRPAPLGHVTRAYGTVKVQPWYTSWATARLGGTLDESWNRLDTAKPIAEPFTSGDQIQTGEDSSAEILFLGGSTLNLQPGSLARFEDAGKEIHVRLILGRAFLEWPLRFLGRKKLVYRDAEGFVRDVPKSSRLVLSLAAAESPEEANAKIQEVQVEGAPDRWSNLELRLLAHGEEITGGGPETLLVPPIIDRGREPAGTVLRNRETIRSLVPNYVFPHNEWNVDVDADDQLGISFEWEKITPPLDDSVVRYEVVVRPAPGYPSEDPERRTRVLKSGDTAAGTNPKVMIEKVGDGGVFLWQVRPVFAKSGTGPSSAPRWLEIAVPKFLAPPELIAPKIE